MTITPGELAEDGAGTIVSKLNGPGGGVTFGSPVAVGTANADGISASAPHADHVHAHGNQSVDTLHALAVAGVSHGFIDKADKTKLDGVAAGATNTPLSAATPLDVGTAAPGSGTAASKNDHVHGHGNQLGGSLHALAISGGADGFFSGADKLKLDGISAGAGGGLAPIDTLANLALLVATPYSDGTKIYVNEVEDTYVLEKAGAHTPDGVAVIAAVGGGYWVARARGRWDDMQGSIGQGAGAAALTVEAFRDTAFLLWYMRYDQLDALNFVYQFSHRWDYSRAVVPHLHVMPVADPAVAEVARFDGYYAWSRPGYAAAPLPALVGWTPFGPIDLPVNPGDVYVQKIISLGAVTPPSWARGSTCLLLWFRRFGTSPADTYNTPKVGGTPAANLAILSTDVHYRVENAAGSETEIPV